LTFGLQKNNKPRIKQKSKLMKKITLILSLFILISACGVKQTRSLLTSGDYDAAIKNAVEGLRGNKNAKGRQDYVYLLEEAFAKAKERDVSLINNLTRENNPNGLEKIYNTYLQLNNRQELIRPLLPLKLLVENREAIFPFDTYGEQITNSKNALSKQLYDNALALIATKDKMTCRRAYDDLGYLNRINSGYKDTGKLMSEAREKGTDYVSVYLKNDTNMVIPSRLQNDMLDFSAFGIDDFWTVYHSNKLKDIVYDYGMIVNFRAINISPEQNNEKQFVKEKQIKDGTKPLLDANGVQIKDQAGNPIRVDNFKTIKISIYEFRQFKSVQVTAKVDYINFKSKQLLDTFPLSSEFNFENVYATFNGDRLASDESYYPFFDKRAVQYPSNEQMIYDCGEDLKAKLKGIISRNKVRR
jgi:hypothetical protein